MLFFPTLLSSTLVKRKYTSEGKFGAARKGWLLLQFISFIASVTYTLHFVLGGVLFPSALRGKTILKCPTKYQIKTLIYGALVWLPVSFCIPFTINITLSFQDGWIKQTLLEMWIVPTKKTHTEAHLLGAEEKLCWNRTSPILERSGESNTVTKQEAYLTDIYYCTVRTSEKEETSYRFSLDHQQWECF